MMIISISALIVLSMILLLTILTVVRFQKKLYNVPMHLASVGWHG